MTNNYHDPLPEPVDIGYSSDPEPEPVIKKYEDDPDASETHKAMMKKNVAPKQPHHPFPLHHHVAVKGSVLEFDAQKNIMSKKVQVRMNLHFAPDQYTPLGKTAEVQPLQMKVVEEGQLMGEPFLQLSYQEAAALMDALWGCGIRPTEVGSPGQLAATQRHLEDMRKIAFEMLSLKH